MLETPLPKEGGCRCGDVRFETSGRPFLVEYCHCRSCRHSAGAPLMAWAAFKPDEFSILSGDLTVHKPSPGVRRSFCGRCGTSLTLTDERFSGEVYVALASFEDAESPSPEIHIWRSQRLSWLETTDDLPRYVQFKGDGALE